MSTVLDREGVELHELTDEEARAVLDRQARRYLGMSGEEFRQAWEAGQLGPDWDSNPAVRRLVMLLPLGR